MSFVFKKNEFQNDSDDIVTSPIGKKNEFSFKDDKIEAPEEQPLLFSEKLQTINKAKLKWLFWTNLLTEMFVILIAEASRGLVLPSIFLYVQSMGGSKKFLGFVVAAFSAGRLIGGIFLGWLFNLMGAKRSLGCALFLSIAGNLLYFFAQETNLWVLLFSRFFIGFGSGTLSVVRASVADVTTKEERVKFMALAGATQFVGFGVVPGLGLLLNFSEFHVGPLPINSYNIPGLILAFFNVIAAVFVFFLPKAVSPQKFELQIHASTAVAKEEQVNKETKHKMHDSMAPESENLIKIVTDTKDENLLEKNSLLKKEATPVFFFSYLQNNPRFFFLLSVGLFLFLNFISRGVLALLETAGTPIFLDISDLEKGDQISTTSLIYLVLGILGLIFFFVIDPIQKRFNENYLLSLSLASLAIGSLFFVEFSGKELSFWQFAIGSFLMYSFASPITQTLVISGFSKALGSRPQGVFMGWIGAVASIGRIVFPSLSGYLGYNASFILSTLISFLAAFATLIFAIALKKKKSLK